MPQTSPSSKLLLALGQTREDLRKSETVNNEKYFNCFFQISKGWLQHAYIATEGLKCVTAGSICWLWWLRHDGVTQVLLLTSFSSTVLSTNTDKVYYFNETREINNEGGLYKIYCSLNDVMETKQERIRCTGYAWRTWNFKNTVELHLSECWLFGSPIFRIG
jgi:hypothetical protein